MAGEYPTAAQMNAEVKDSINFLANPPACRVYHSIAQSLTTGTLTGLVFNSERWDTHGFHSTTTNTHLLTAPVAGLYVITASIRYATSGAGTRYVEFYLNGATVIASKRWSPVTFAENDLSTTYKLAIGDTVQFRAFQDSGVTLNVESLGQTSPEFSATWVGKG